MIAYVWNDDEAAYEVLIPITVVSVDGLIPGENKLCGHLRTVDQLNNKYSSSVVGAAMLTCSRKLWE